MIYPAPATMHLFTNPAYRVPEPGDVRAVIRILDLTADEVAGLVGVKDGRAVRRWLAPPTSKTHAKIDYAIWRVLLLEAGLVRRRKHRAKRERKSDKSSTTSRGD